jgi:hypothetical protein
MMLILFKPFRQLCGLVPESNLQNWKMSYDTWELTDLAKRFLKNNLDYYDCRCSSDHDVDRAKNYFNRLPGEDDFIYGNENEEQHDIEVNEEDEMHYYGNANEDVIDFDADEEDDAYLLQLFEQSDRNTLIGDVNALASAIKFFNNTVTYTYQKNLFPDYETILNNRTFISIMDSLLKDPRNSDFPREIIVRQLRMNDSYIWTDSNSSILIDQILKYSISQLNS